MTTQMQIDTYIAQGDKIKADIQTIDTWLSENVSDSAFVAKAEERNRLLVALQRLRLKLCNLFDGKPEYGYNDGISIDYYNKSYASGKRNQ